MPTQTPFVSWSVQSVRSVPAPHGVCDVQWVVVPVAAVLQPAAVATRAAAGAKRARSFQARGFIARDYGGRGRSLPGKAGAPRRSARGGTGGGRTARLRTRFRAVSAWRGACR